MSREPVSGWGLYPTLEAMHIVGIALLVVGYQTFKAVTQNPIKALRSQ